ncbi:unnamed protein product [Mytilus coruscus]|uniref:Uncharacterized protein n=1 Tax=Mytilus coruscus TaxID=42192 RepID=A0A6J8E585_MYTCO|nr:unnamed protein product [Mytilus coruscus]
MAGPYACLFHRHDNVPCGASKNYNTHEELYVKNTDCVKSTFKHLRSLHALDQIDISESALILSRAGLFVSSEFVNNLSICQSHRDQYGIYWKRGNTNQCKHPLRTGQQKADRGINFNRAVEIYLLWGKIVLVGDESNWDQFLTPAPFAFALIGELILISSDTVFSLEKKPPRDGFTYLRYPNSFRASLIQVTYAGLSDFNEAHTSMDQIYLHSGNVDGNVKNAVRFLLQSTPNEVDSFLPMSLTKIQYIADE